MTVVAFGLAVVAALAWIAATATGDGPVADRAVAVAWQLAALSFLSAPDALIGEGGEVVLQVALGALAALAVAVRLALLRRAGSGGWPNITPWLLAYAAVLALAALFSSSPGIAALRGLRAVVLFAVFGQAAALDRATLRRLLVQLTTGLTVVVAIGPLVAGGDAFLPLRAPVIRWALRAPVIGSGPHIVAAIGLGLVLATAWRWVDGDRPPFGSRRWWLGLALPAVAGLVLVAGSQKRAFWVALAVLLVTWLALCHRRWLAPAVAALALGAVSLLAIGPLRDLWDRERARPNIDNIASVRTAIFEASLDRFAERPLIGDGLGVGNREMLIDVGQAGLGWSSHSEVGAALAATGLVGFAVIVWGHLTGWGGARTAWRDRRDPLPLLVVAGSVALLPFWRVLQEPLFVGLPYYTIVLPLHGWRPPASMAWRRARRSRSSR